MKRNASIFVVLLLLAIVPVTCTFLFTGEHEDAVATAGEDGDEGVAATTGGDGSGGGEGTAATTGGDGSGGGEGTAATKGAAGSGEASKVPVFKGFEDPRYQQYDALIKKLVDDFNRKRSSWAGSTSGQAQGIPEITAAQVKAHMIQETGGGDVNSRAAWARDPLQVNVPGDWNPYKKYLGLKEPRRRNEGSGEKNLRAGVMLLARKGFGVSGQPAANRPDGAFDGWANALQRYNGRSDKAADGRKYSTAYSERIRQRAQDPAVEVPIPIPTKKGKK